MRRCSGGHAVGEELGAGEDGETQVDQVCRDENLTLPSERPRPLPADRQPGIVVGKQAVLGRQLPLRAAREPVGAHGEIAERLLGVHDELGIGPRAGRVALQGLHNGDVAGTDGVDSAASAVEISLSVGVVPVALGSKDRRRIIEQSGVDREGRLILAGGQRNGLRDEAVWGLEPTGAAQPGGTGLPESTGIHSWSPSVWVLW